MTLVVEDALSACIAEKVVRYADPRRPILPTVYGQRGNSYIKNSLPKFNLAAKHAPYFILTDLDARACAPSLVKEWLDGHEAEPRLLFRVAVREVEAWLLADRTNFATFLGISDARIPRDPEGLPDPKATLINLATSSKTKRLRERIVPSKQSKAKQGPDYNDALSEFVRATWDLKTAAQEALSLARTIRAIQRCTF